MKKELIVFVVSADEAKDMISGYSIENWKEYKDNEPLPQKALNFIQQAKDNGRFYTISEFMNHFNLDNELNASNDYIFITDKY